MAETAPPKSASVHKPKISLPKAGGAVRGISEKLNYNAANGTATLGVPLPTTPGREGFTPDLQLGYDSGAGNGAFGMGWSLQIPSISRRTDKGLPRYQDALESDIFLLAGAEDLVPLLDAGGTRVRITRTVHGIDYEIYPYLPRIEGMYARIERWVRTATGTTHWRTITSDNVTSLYGFDPDSTISSGDDPDHVFRFLICRRYDGRGSLITYTYSAENADNVDINATNEVNRSPADRTRQRYVKSVRYSFTTPYFDDGGAASPAPALPDDWHFELVFDYGEHDVNVPRPGDALVRPVRPDPFSSYRATYEVRTYRRCERVLMFHHFEGEAGVGRDCLVRALELVYDDELAVPEPRAPIYSLLASVVEVGFRRDGAGYKRKALPPLEVDYSKPLVDATVRMLPRDDLANLPQGVDGRRFRFADLDAEGMPGILSDEGTAWHYQHNRSPLSGVPLLDGTEPPVVASFAPMVTIGSVPSARSLHGELQLLDVRGEGRLDVVSFASEGAGFWTRTPESGWESFVAFQSQPTTNPIDSKAHIVDLTGDGRPDILVGENNVWTMYPSLGAAGYGAAEIVQAPWDEATGGPPVYANAEEALVLADMVGDGLSDLVRIRNGEICYWPNLGYGRFGRKVTMGAAPRFASVNEFDPKRIHLVDIDGSGSSDVLYVGRDGVSVWFNRSGNTWSDVQRLAIFPADDQLATVQAVDLLGTGTACLVWSSPLVAQAHAPLRYVDLMSGHKPHLLTRSRNNMGAETRITYAPSTRFYLEDRRAGIPWITRMPFPMQLVERLETYDWIGRSRFVTRYAYHHGHYDGEEREFRGFGMVESWDTESHRADTLFPEAENWDATSWSPPVHTKTWFHTGVFVESGDVSKQFSQEYWIEPALRPAARAADLAAMTLPDSNTVPAALNPAEEREARRALKSHVLRMETYADDGSLRAEFPYSVVEHCYEVRRIQPMGSNRYTVFSAHERETLTFHYERTPEDPRVAHDVVLEVDEFDHPLRAMSVVYPRRAGLPAPEPTLPAAFRQMLDYDQHRLHVMGTEHRTTNTAFSADAHRLPQPSETITAEVTGCKPASNRAGITNLFRFAELDAGWATAWDGAHDVPYEELPRADIDGIGALPATIKRRIVEHARVYYRSDDLTTLLPLGTVEPLALPGTGYHLALTPGLLARVLDGRVGAVELTEGGYVQLPGSAGWWIGDGSVHYSPGDADPPLVELATARQHFFIVRRELDTFGAISRIEYDVHDIAPVRTADPLGNTHVAENDYRVLSPREVTDENGNRSEVVFDVLGHVVGSAIKGKITETLGDTLAGFVVDLGDAAIAAHLADPLAGALALLGSASARVIYDSDAYYRTRELPTPDAPVMSIIERETHASDPGGATSRCRHELSYADGHGRQIQRKIQAEPGPLVEGGAVVSPRWVGTGWLLADNKGRTVREFEPFFTTTHHFEFDQTIGVSRYTFYDPIGRVVATLAPNNTWHKTIYGAWREEQWDANDTVAISDPRLDLDVGDHFRRVLGVGPFTSWHDLRITGTFGVDAIDRLNERDAAQKAAVHAGTPHVDHYDSQRRPCLSVTDLGSLGRQPTRTVFDAEGDTLATIDPLGRRTVEYMVREPHGADFVYVSARDVAGRELFHNLMDAGTRRTLPDVVSHPIRSWDDRGHAVRLRYDLLRRPTHRIVATGGGPEHVVSRTVYGEGHPELNLNGQIFRHYDQAGLTSNENCDFKGNLIDRSRHLAREYRDEVDWSPLGDETDAATLDVLGAPLLAPGDRFFATAIHDAVNRPIQAVTPHTPAMRPNVLFATYNEAGKVERVDLWEQVAAMPTTLLDPATADVHVVTALEYDQYGDRISATYGNGTVTKRSIDPLTKRLVRIVTSRPASFPGDERTVQDLHYTYDAGGNCTRARDDADIHNVIYFRNRRVEPSADYTYDAGNRLIRATGREHLGQSGGALGTPAQPTESDAPRTQLAHPGDGNAMGTYIETYAHDPVGNLLEMLHMTPSGNWRRRYAYAEPSTIEPTVVGNRLSATSVPGDLPAGPYSATYQYDVHGNAIGMPHLSGMTWNERDALRSTSRQVVAAGTPETTYYNYDAGDERLRKVTDRSSANGGKRRSERIRVGSIELYREYAADGVTVTLTRETMSIVAQRKIAAVIEWRTSGSDPGPARALKYQYVTLIDSSALELDEAAAVISYEEFHPYGSTAYHAVARLTDTPKRLRYAGKMRDEESGFYYSGARYYAPWLGRWFNPDPEGLKDGPNLYCFVRGNPITIVDPTGTIGIVIVIGGGIILTGTEVLAIGGMAACATGVVVIAQHPPRAPNWHPFAETDDPLPVPPQAPPIPAPVNPPAPPPVAPPVEAPTNPPVGPVPWPPFGTPGPGTIPWPVGPIPWPVGPYPLPWPIGPIPWPIAPPIPITGGPKATPKKKPDTKKKPKTDDPVPADPKPKPKEKKKKKPKERYVTYTKFNKKTGKTYIGRAHGPASKSAADIVKGRDSKHTKLKKEGFGPAKVDTEVVGFLPYWNRANDPAYWAMRGREQQMIDKLGGSQKDAAAAGKTTKARNPIRGVAKDNPDGRDYDAAATAEFGRVHKYTGR